MSSARDRLDTHDVHAFAADLRIALRAGSLDAASFPVDPADRFIYAMALQHDAALVSADERLREVDPARVIW